MQTVGKPADHARRAALIADKAPFSELRPPCRDEMLAAHLPPDQRNATSKQATGFFLAVFVLGLAGGWMYDRLPEAATGTFTGNRAVATVVEQIIQAESNGCATARNKRSSATGAAQFIDETWLRLIRAHRPELAQRSERVILEMRRDVELSREIAALFARQNAGILRRHGLSVTPGTLYLSHFAGGAGARALLSAPAHADAAMVMAQADATGRTTRDRIVRANPFLERFTVADLKGWADRKMREKQRRQGCR
jgi:hypothetical protein